MNNPTIILSPFCNLGASGCTRVHESAPGCTRMHQVARESTRAHESARGRMTVLGGLKELHGTGLPNRPDDVLTARR